MERKRNMIMIEKILSFRRKHFIIWSLIYRNKFLKLANLENPLLHKLMLSAPGTFHHSIIVGSMMEFVAPVIGLNPLKAKVCGYYHDIGKLKNPHFFIENRTGESRDSTDKIDPKEACVVLIKHLENGEKIAKENNLSREVIDAIICHHGNSLMPYYYEKAKKLHGEDRINVEDYRYKGPKPVSKLSGLTMIADLVEATFRTLKNPTPARIHYMANSLITRIIYDGQLDECILTCKDLNEILKSFTKILASISKSKISEDKVDETQEFEGS